MPTLARGQWGVTMDDAGRVYRNWNDDPLRVDLLPARYYARNPAIVRTRGLYEPTTADMSVWPIRRNPGVNRGYREGSLRADGSLAIFSAAGTPVVYRGDRLPADLAGNVFVTEPAGNLVRRLIVTVDATARPVARNAYERAEFMASTDERFRPVNLYSAPDGTLYVVDMYRGVIQHGAYQSEYLKNHIRTHKLDQPIRHGRIYRVVHTSMSRGPRPALSAKAPAQLVETLSHPNGWWRDTAQRLLVERGDTSVAGALRALVAGASDGRTRLHALWTLDGIDALDVETLKRALDDRSEAVRASAVRAAERWLQENDQAVASALQARADDDSPQVRRQLAASLGALPPEPREAAVLGLLDRHGDDPVLVDAAVSGVAGLESRILERLLGTSGQPRADAVSTLVRTLVRGRRGDALDEVLRWIAEPGRVAWQREALLAGLQGGRAEIGNEEPFARRAPAPVALPRRPDAFLALGRSRDPGLAAAVTRVAEGLDWPGKPKPANTTPPLTPAERERFTAGQQIYGTMCAPCHQLDGRGLNGLAPPLLGSKWVVGRAGHAARIVLNGKEGQALMPPLSALTDEEVAAVLTYVRRAWGQTASPVEPSLVREARGASTGRTRPWTDEELARVTQPDGLPGR